MSGPITGQSIPTIPVPNVELFENESGVTEGCNQNGPWAIKKYLVNWNDRFLFAQAMAGSTRQSGSGTSGAWIRNIPYPYPANPVMYAKELTIEPRGQYIYPAIPIAWQYAEITVSFGSLGWDAFPAVDDPFGFATISGSPEDSIPFVSQRLSFGYETYEIPAKLSFLSDNKPFIGSAGYRMPITTMSLSFERFPRIPLGDAAAYVGKINSEVFLGCDVGTVFFEGLETDRSQSFSANNPASSYESNTTQTLSVVFRWRPVPWNRFLRSDRMEFEGVTDNVGNPVYTGIDFNTLINRLNS